MKDIFQIPAIVDGVSPRKDGGMSIRFVTNELNDEQKVLIMGYYQTFGWMLFKETNIQEDDIGGLEDVRKDLGGKSPSQRLRSVLFVMYRQKGDTSLSFEQYYGQKMEQFINHVKSGLSK